MVLMISYTWEETRESVVVISSSPIEVLRVDIPGSSSR